jgi:acetate---CoA ligase (ADP-forming)
VHAEAPKFDLNRLLRPRSVAIVGISPEPGSIGANALANLKGIGFAGDVHLVSRTSREIGGRRCYGSIDELPEGIDTAVLALPRQAVVEAAKACIRRKIGAAMVFASGFAEMDEAGRREQEMLAGVARTASLAVCGPNCIGLVNIPAKVALTFEPLAPPVAGKGRAIGVVTQSGAMCSTLRLALLAKELNLSCVVSTGNEAVLTTEDFLAFLIDDQATQVVILFMEEVRDPARFLALAARARERKKPIVLMHPGRSARAQSSARTHTGAMVGNHAVMAALTAREAVVLVETLEELIDSAEIFARFPQPPVNGAAVMTNSGAFKGYALDFAETIGLELPELSPASAAAIKAVLPPFAAIENPVDVTAQSIRDPTILGRTATELLTDPAMGSLVISIVPGAPRFAMDKARSIVAGIGEAGNEKPGAVAIMGDETPLPAEFPTLLREQGLAFFRSPDRALRAMARATWYGRATQAVRRHAAPMRLPNYQLPASGALAEYQGKALLASLGIAVPAGGLARDPDEARKIARRIGFPVALKAQSAALTHKSDTGGVMLDVGDEPALLQAWERLHANTAKADYALDGVLVEAMAPRGVELVVGARREDGWGTVLTVGLGGIWIETLHDLEILPANADRGEIIDGLLKLKGAPLLSGARGAPAVDLDAIADCAMRLGALLAADPRIIEIEINPLRAHAGGAVALDVLTQVQAA